MKTLNRLFVVLSVALASVSLQAAAVGSQQLISAIKSGDEARAQALLEQSADLKATDVDGSTALHWAIELDQTDVALRLINAGADVEAATRFKVTPLSLAARNGNAAVIDRLIEAGVDPNATALAGEPALMTAAMNGRVEALRALLRNGADVHAVDADRGQNALMWAAGAGNAKAAELLVEFGTDINAKSEGGFSALMFAVLNNELETTETLLKLGANVEDRIPDGTNALNMAIVNAHYDVASLLLDHGADPNAEDPRGSALMAMTWMRTPGSSWEAAATGTEPIPVPRPSGEHMTALQLAEKLLQKGADPNARLHWQEPRMTKGLGTTRNPPNINLGRHHLSFNGATPFYSAARNGDADFMRLLVKYGADPNINTEVGVTPLMAATCLDYYEGESPGPTTGVSEARRLEAVKLAVELGNPVNAKTTFGDFPMVGSPEFTLLTYPENIDDLLGLGVGDPRWDGMAAIHGAVICHQPSILEYLIEAGADVNTKNRLGWTPLMVTQGIFMANSKKEFPTEAEILKKAGATMDGN